MSAADEQRRDNLATFYNGRQKAAKTDRELAAVMIDRARAVAIQRARAGDEKAWYSLASTLADWCGTHGA